MAEYRVAGADEIAEGTVRRVEVGGRSLALLKVGGAIRALDDRCPHAGGPLGEGIVEGGLLRCPWHERRFDPTTGVCLTHPATRPATCFALRVEDDSVIVSLP